jgi:hypothetical protein
MYGEPSQVALPDRRTGHSHSWQFLPFSVMSGIVGGTSKKEVHDAEHEHFSA